MLVASALSGLAGLMFEPRSGAERAPAVHRRALTQRVAFVVVDGLRHDRFLSLMPRTRAIASQRGVVCEALTPALTYTTTGIFALGTGATPGLDLVPKNFEGTAVDLDSLPAAVTRASGRVSLFGELVWHDLFAPHVSIGRAHRDRGLYGPAEAGLFSRLDAALTAEDCDLCILHETQPDKLAHRYGIFAPSYERAVEDLDRALAEIVDAHDDVTFVVTSDHGALDSGNHGGPDPDNRRSFIAAWGPGIRSWACADPFSSLDIPTTIAVLLGAPIPSHSEGVVHPEMLTFGSELEARAVHRELLGQKRALWRWTFDADADPSADARALAEALQGAETRPSRLWLALLLLPLGLAIALLVEPSVIRACWQARSTRHAIASGLAVVSLGPAFANLVYPKVSYLTAVVTFVAGAAVVALLWNVLVVRRSEADVRPTVAWIGGLAVVLAAESHASMYVWAGLVGAVWFSGGAPLGALASAVALGCLQRLGPVGLGEEAWIGCIGLAIATAAFLGTRWFGSAAIAAAAYLLATTVSTSLVPAGLLASAAMVAVQWRSPARRITWALVGLGFVYAQQASSIQFASVALLCAGLARGLIDGRTWSIGLGSFAVVGGAYATLLPLGSSLGLSNFDVEVGFLRNSVPLWLPINVALTVLYYAVPVMVPCLATGLVVPARARAVVVVAAAIVAMRLLCLAAGFVWGEITQGTWSASLAESLVLLGWFTGLLGLVLPLLSPPSKG